MRKNYNQISDKGELIEKSGYHQCRNCRCKLTTRKGAYRDETYTFEGITYHFYHQNLVVINKGNKYTIDSCGYKTKTTKERINRYIPNRYTVIQDDFNWYVIDKVNDTRKEFKDGMLLEA